MGQQPLVSAIMPTRDRQEMTLAAIDCFIKQDWPNKELIIVDDIDAPSLPGYASTDNIRYFALPTREVLGTKRNIACALSNGEYIVHFDSDDYSFPGRITEHINFLETNLDIQVTAFSTFLMRDTRVVKVLDNGAWRPSTGWWVAEHADGTALCYRKSWWVQHPFPNIQISEDALFWEEAGDKAACTIGLNQIIILNHPGNATGRLCGGVGMHEVPVPECATECQHAA